MPIKFNCPHCDAAIKAPETHAGQKLPCPKCGEPVVVQPPAAPQTPPTPPAFPNVKEPEPEADIPEIVTRDSRTYDSPPPAPTSPADNAFAAPQTRSERVVDSDLTSVRIVDLKLPFRSVFKFAVQLYLCLLLLSFVLWAIMMVFMMILAAIGFGLGGL